jgi:hypothetical protein
MEERDSRASEKKLPKPHRCNARLEDFVQSLFTLSPTGAILPAWRNFRACMASDPGQEPTMEYIVLEDPEKYLDGSRLTGEGRRGS